MSFKLTKVNNLPGELISVVTDDIPESLNANNLWYTQQRVSSDIQAQRVSNPTIQDKHFYTVGEVAVKTGDLYWQIISPIEILEARAYLKIPATGNLLEAQVVKNTGANPSDILFTLELLPNSSSVISNTPAVTLLAGDYIRIDILQVGSATPGSDLIISFKYRSII